MPRGSQAERVNGDPELEQFLRALGKRVRLLRLTRELTQDELAAAAGISRSFVSVVEHGKSGVDVTKLHRMAAVLGVPLRDLIDVPGVSLTGADRAEGLPS